MKKTRRWDPRARGSIYLAMLRHSLKHAGAVNLTVMAGSLAYTTVLSVVPLLAVMFYVFKLFGGLEYAYKQLLPFLLANLSEGTGQVVQEHLDTFVHQVGGKAVGWAGIAGLLVTAVTTYLTVSACFNRIWTNQQAHRLQHRIFRAFTLLTTGPLLLASSVALTTLIAAQVKIIPHSGQLLAFLLSVMLFSMIYALVPMVKVPLKTILVGSIFPAVLWEIAKYGYTLYTKKAVSYSAFYGSFAAIPLFLLWIYIGWCITLFGAVWVHTLQTWQRRP